MHLFYPGVLKEKFPVPNYMRLSPVMACNVIKACATIHNIEPQNEIDMLNVGAKFIQFNY